MRWRTLLCLRADLPVLHRNCKDKMPGAEVIEKPPRQNPAIFIHSHYGRVFRNHSFWKLNGERRKFPIVSRRAEVECLNIAGGVIPIAAAKRIRKNDIVIPTHTQLQEAPCFFKTIFRS